MCRPSTHNAARFNNGPYPSSHSTSSLMSRIPTEYITSMYFYTMAMLGAVLFGTALAIPKDIRGYMAACNEGGCDPTFFVCKVSCFD